MIKDTDAQNKEEMHRTRYVGRGAELPCLLQVHQSHSTYASPTWKLSEPCTLGWRFWQCWGLHRCACALHCCAPAFSSCREGGLLSSYSVGASHCGGVSCCGALALGSAWALMVVTPELSCHVACGILFSRPGIESMSTSNTTPALASRFLTIGPPGKFLWGFL